jgi:soluble cytochrome b562
MSKDKNFSRIYESAAAAIAEVKRLRSVAKDLHAQLDKANAQLQEGNIPNVSGSNEYEASESALIIGNVRKRYHELETDTGFDWRSFYMGWIEGRVEMLHAKSFEPTDEQIRQASMEYAKRNKSGKIIDVEELKAMRNFYYDTYKEITYEFKKIIGENVR